MSLAPQASETSAEGAPGVFALPEGFGPPERRCGRCRLLFAGDPTLDPGSVQDWWLCPPCRAVLLPPPATSGG